MKCLPPTFVTVCGLAFVLTIAGCPPHTLSANERVVRVGCKAFTESVVLATIAEQLIETVRADGTSFAAETVELGGTQVVWKALLADRIDLYPEYTGTLAQEMLADENVTSLSDMRQALKRRGVTMLGPLGFNNNYAIGMLQTKAAELGITKISDLSRYPELKFGFSNEFMDRTDGWPGLRRAYSLPQTDVRGLDHDLAYRGLSSGAIDVMELYTTDAEIEYYDMRVLEDDRNYFPNYEAVLLVRDEIAEIPALRRTLDQLVGAIDKPTMIDLNAQVKLKRVPVACATADFLNEAFGIQPRLEMITWWQQLARYTVAHLQLVGTSLFPAIGVAMLLGVVAAKVTALEQPILATVGIIQTIPALALLVLLIPLLGIGFLPAVAALFLYSLLPIVRATHQGLTGIPANLTESALAIGLPPWQRFMRIELPMAMPAIVSGIKVAAVLNVGFATLGALISAGGYGQPIMTGIRLDDTHLILMGAIPSALLALFVQWAFDFSERWLVPRGLRL